MYRKLLNVLLFLVSCMAFGAVAAGNPPAAIESGIVKARVTAVASNYTSFTVRIGDGEEKLVLDEVAAKALQAKLRINPGDRISVILGAPEAAGGTSVKEFMGLEKQVGVGYRVLFLFIGLVVILACFAVFSTGNLRGFVIGADNRYSNSKIQIVLWFGSLFVIYLGTLMLRVYVYGWDLLGGVGITENLLALSGLSAFTYGSAKAITSSQHENAKQGLEKAKGEARVAQGNADAPGAAAGLQDLAADAAGLQSQAQQQVDLKTKGTPEMKNLFCDDLGNLDFGDSQMFFIVLLTVAIFILTSFHFLEWVAYSPQIILPDLDTTLLSTFGLGQGAYLVKKAASPLGKG